MTTPLAVLRVIVGDGKASMIRHGPRSAATKQTLAYASSEDKSTWGK